MERDQVTQRAPAFEVDLTDFPTKVVAAQTVWRRAHRDEYGPWYFSSSGAGRFDLPAPMGTCYVANSEEGAVREVIGPDFVASGLVTDTFLVGRVVSQILLPHEIKAAKLNSNEAFRFRVSNELCTVTDYSISQSWAHAFHRHRFSGVWYQPRFSPGSGRALGIFGPAGPSEGSAHDSRPVKKIVDEMAGIQVLSTGTLDGYTIVDTPLS